MPLRAIVGDHRRACIVQLKVNCERRAIFGFDV